MNNALISMDKVWGGIWIAVVNEVSRHKNRVIFKGGVIDVLEAFALVQLKTSSWVSSKSQSAFFSFSDWCIDPIVCIRMIL